jgi:hypothetical protein
VSVRNPSAETMDIEYLLVDDTGLSGFGVWHQGTEVFAPVTEDDFVL